MKLSAGGSFVETHTHVFYICSHLAHTYFGRFSSGRHSWDVPVKNLVRGGAQVSRAEYMVSSPVHWLCKRGSIQPCSSGLVRSVDYIENNNTIAEWYNLQRVNCHAAVVCVRLWKSVVVVATDSSLRNTNVDRLRREGLDAIGNGTRQTDTGNAKPYAC